MTYLETLERIINDGIEAAKEDYGRKDSPENKARLKGSIEGFEACRGKTPEQLARLLADERCKTNQASSILTRKRSLRMSTGAFAAANSKSDGSAMS